MAGKAYLIGAGPGDPRLITLRGVEALGESDLVLYDDLVDVAMLRHAKKGARVLCVGKRAGRVSPSQEAITRVLVANVARGLVVARLKGGDPFVFGRGGEEALALARAGLDFEIVPGVSSPLGAAAYARIPLTMRDVASSVAFVTGHDKNAKSRVREVAGAATIVVFMGGRRIGAIARELLACGRPAATPVALVRGATTEAQDVAVTTIGALAKQRTGETRASAMPMLVIIGDVVSFAGELAPRARPSRRAVAS